jgi:uncharacterized protein YutE (UPF0331/DUF86 family)
VNVVAAPSDLPTINRPAGLTGLDRSVAGYLDHLAVERGLAAIIARSFIAAASLIRTNSMTVVKSYEEAAERLRTLPEQDAEIANDLQLAAKLEAFAAKR